MSDLKVLSIVNGMVQPRAELDIPIDSNGQFSDEPIFVSGIAKINQDVAKGLLTALGSDFLAPNYGTNLPNLIGAGKVDDIADQITEEVQTLLGYLANFNLNEPADEQAVELVDLQATDAIDTVQVKMTLRTGTGQPITVTV